MKKETRTVCYDEDLQLEAYQLEGIVQPFPNHFHDYYVIGLIELGARFLSCRKIECVVKKGDIILFNPKDNHHCAQCDEGVLDYRAINIPVDTMKQVVKEITKEERELRFSNHVIVDEELRTYVFSLHEMIMRGSTEFEKEEALIYLITILVKRYGEVLQEDDGEYKNEINAACQYMEKHYDQPISLGTLCGCANLSKSTLLRIFTREIGVTPYRYLQSLRIDKAKKLLEQGIPLIDVAGLTGFVDQSHFTRFFSMFIGLTPSAYRAIFKEKEGATHD